MEYKYGDRNVRDRYIRDERGKRDKDRWSVYPRKL